MIGWADVIFVMESKHMDIIRQRFSFDQQQLMLLNIEDDYQFNDPELIDVLKANLNNYL